MVWIWKHYEASFLHTQKSSLLNESSEFAKWKWQFMKKRWKTLNNWSFSNRQTNECSPSTPTFGEKKIYNLVEDDEITIELTQFPFFRELSEKYKIFQGTSSKSCCRWRKFLRDWLSNFSLHQLQNLLWRKVDRMHKYPLIPSDLFNILAFFSQW